MKPNYTDERGTITDLIVTDDYSITHITFTEGAVRGNHYHKETEQIDVILNGKFRMARCPENLINREECKLYTELITGDKITHEPNVAHAYQAVTKGEMVSICFGTRKGTDYEKDTYRLETPLL
jgi:quercetin dioxygenase-like cupin family protein